MRVRGADWRDTRVTVMPQFGEAFEVPLSTDQFDLDLGLFSTYLVRAAHAGCATKEIVFDLWVPDAYRNAVFHFPFEIVLETFRANEKPYSYEHPVGIVFFDETKADFTYTTDYEQVERARSLPTMEQRMETHIALHPKPVNELAAYEALFAKDPNAEEPHSDTMRVEQTSRPSEPHTALPPEPVPGSRTTEPSFTIAPSPRSTAQATTSPTVKKATTVPAAPSRDKVAAKQMEFSSRMSTRLEIPSLRQDQGSHEFSVFPTMVIVIDRFGNGSTSTEVRKVTHAYGAVFYFQDGAPITERAYNEKLAEFVRMGQP
ncbi:MAG: hypothetical protein ACOH13_02125 [Flavobacteriales bacterium]